jgi:hypothetical protein
MVKMMKMPCNTHVYGSDQVQIHAHIYTYEETLGGSR